ncbi:glycoside hydrolase [Tamlana nanhaiensis]|uniref:Glycoside hydrolase n=1 Tax=Neotamlana nanhaiensis TaxID=1382798 RepID=A0A0D7W6L2_9FLAO|nr:glycosyl hydrolase [Tamlana nanhaiensis]KJD34755.1 glycoside hydrolase [Tamlana nanhaiensis]
MQKIKIIVSCLTVLLFINCDKKQDASTTENSIIPEITNLQKPWTRWWWMGSAVDSTNIKQNLIDLHKVGIGGVEIAPIYGAKGEEDNFIDYLSPKWMNMLSYTTKIADSLNMQVDLTLGTGWPYGGPQVTPKFAATKLITETYAVKKGETFKNTIEVSNEKDKKLASFNYLLAYGDNGEFIDLTSQVKDNTINWTAENANYNIIAVFTGKTRQQVKRAAPGGSGYTLDHYSTEALNQYVVPFDDALNGFDGNIRSIFNDSYEVYGTDFTPNFFEAFKTLRGYDLKPHLQLLLSTEDDDEANRIKSDYRETLSDLLLHDFDEPWTTWANKHNFKSRLQAHGSPGNLLDLYAAADIPECETFGSMPYDIPGLRREQEDIREGDADPVMLKFSSSAAHVAGKPLTSSETFTWLRDHFKVALSQTKPEVEDLFLNGVNHVFLHGTTYSPKRATWPGWKFYASVNFNPNLAIGEDENQLFNYIANCQALLQEGKPDNDVLLYYPIYDTWGSQLKNQLFFQFKIHSLKEWLHDTPFYNTGKLLMNTGYGVDFLSDNYLSKATFANGKIEVPGGAYKAIVVPNCDKMSLETLKQLIALKKEGATIIFEGLPSTIPGFNNYEARTTELKKLLADNANITDASDVISSLLAANIAPETLVNSGLKFIKRDVDGNKTYYLVNHTNKAISEFIPINGIYDHVAIINPNTGAFGNGSTKIENGKTLVQVSIKPGEALFLKTIASATETNWEYFNASSDAVALNEPWEVSFLRGGPSLPETKTIDSLQSWTTFNEASAHFSGTAQYTTTITISDENTDNWLLKLGDVRESAKIWVNDEFIGALWSNPFEIELGKLKQGENTLKVEVTNLSANRIRAKELRGEEWKIFYEINMVNKDYQKFDATLWQPMLSGILGPVTLTSLQKIN